MISARGDKRRLRAVTLHELEAEHATIEAERALEIGHLQVHVPDARFRIDGAAPVHFLRRRCSLKVITVRTRPCLFKSEPLMSETSSTGIGLPSAGIR